MLFNTVCCLSFTLEQATLLATWDLVRPEGLGVRVVKDHELFPEVAVLFRHDPEDVRYLVRYLINHTSGGTVVQIRASGGKWALPTLEAAMAKVLALENGNATAARAAAQTPEIGVVPQARPCASPGSCPSSVAYLGRAGL
jgi:hypothetical protein